VKTFVQRPVNIALLLSGMIVLALIMLWPTLNMGLWLDELCSVNDVAYPDVQTVIAKMWGRMDDLHPPLSYVPLFAAIRLFGLTDLVVRTPPLVCGILLIPVVYWLGKTVHSRMVGLIAAFFATVSPFANYYDCQSRGYSLAALLTALCLITFCKLVDGAKEHKTAAFIGVVLTTAALCYTEYISCFILPALGIATIWICLSMRNDPARSAQALPTFIRCGAALTLGFLLFVPWIPSALIQSGSMRDLQDLAPREYWPLIFSFNLMMMFPVPLIIGIPTYTLGLLIAIVYAIRHRKNFVGFKKFFAAVPNAYVIVVCAVVIPSSLIGYITPWFIGLFRYIYPYTAAGWTLLAILLYNLFGFSNSKAEAGADTQTETGAEVDTEAATNAKTGAEAPETTSKKHFVRLAILLFLIFANNAFYLSWFTSKPQSGLRTMARDALAGKYDHSLILVVPDVIGPTLGYYLPPKEREAHHIVIAGYPRWNDPFTPIAISDLKGLWGPTIPDEAAKRIEALPSQGFKYLVIAKDNDKQIELLSTKTVPRMTRVKALLEIINKKYEKLSELHYAGLTEDATAIKYRLTSETALPKAVGTSAPQSKP
jgi:hypothetical protein